MDMSMTMDMASATSSAMADATSTAMSDMSVDSSTMPMAMADMVMNFFTSTTTSLYSSAWTPQTTGQYIGTCIFLIALAAIFQGLVGLRQNFTALLALWTYRHETGILRAQLDDETLWKVGTGRRRPWNINEALARAWLDTVLAGVSYLLMLAVMTMNVGYFLSILGGTFVGSFVMNDWVATAAHRDGH